MDRELLEKITAQAQQIESDIELGNIDLDACSALISLYAVLKKDKQYIKQSIEKMKRAVECELNSGTETSETYVKLATIYGLDDEKESARNFYNKALELEPDSIPALLGIVSLSSISMHPTEEELQEAKSILTKLSQGNPDNVEVCAKIAVIKSCIGEYDEAVSDFEKIIELTSDEEDIISIREKIDIVKNIKNTMEKMKNMCEMNEEYVFNSSEFDPKDLEYKDSSPFVKILTIGIIAAGFLYLLYEFLIVK